MCVYVVINRTDNGIIYMLQGYMSTITQCGVDPVCVPIELLSTTFNLPQPSVVLVQCSTILNNAQTVSPPELMHAEYKVSTYSNTMKCDEKCIVEY